jgi:hypothetical protein
MTREPRLRGVPVGGHDIDQVIGYQRSNVNADEVAKNGIGERRRQKKECHTGGYRAAADADESPQPERLRSPALAQLKSCRNARLLNHIIRVVGRTGQPPREPVRGIQVWQGQRIKAMSFVIHEANRILHTRRPTCPFLNNRTRGASDLFPQSPKALRPLTFSPPRGLRPTRHVSLLRGPASRQRRD